MWRWRDVRAEGGRWRGAEQPSSKVQSGKNIGVRGETWWDQKGLKKGLMVAEVLEARR